MREADGRITGTDVDARYAYLAISSVVNGTVVGALVCRITVANHHERVDRLFCSSLFFLWIWRVKVLHHVCQSTDPIPYWRFDKQMKVHLVGWH